MLYTCLVAVFAGIVQCGCAGRGVPAPVPTRPAPGGGLETVVVADWTDVYPAALVSADRVQAAVLGRDEEQDGLQLIRLRTVQGMPGHVLAERLGPASAEPQEIRLTARLGLFGDREQEDLLLRAMAQRLGGLAGRDWAPLR